MHTFFISDLIHCLRHVSNNQVFILRTNCTCSFMVCFIHPYKQPGRCQDVFDNKEVSLACYCYITHWKWIVNRTPAIGNLLQKFPTFYGCRPFIVVITKVRQWSLSTARYVHSIPLYPTYLRSTLIISSTLPFVFSSGISYVIRIV
jgi:hypothetical protein